MRADLNERLIIAARQELARRRSEREHRGELEESLAAFHKSAFHLIDPAPYRHNWHLEAISEHLEAVTDGLINRLIITMPPRFSKPVAEAEMVLTARGRIPLREVVVGDRVLTHTGVYRYVLAVHVQGDLPVVEVRTWQGRRVRAALDHPFLTTRGWVAAQDLKAGDVAAAISPLSHPADERMEPHEARALGYLVGDGSTKYAGIGYVSADADMLDDFEQCATTLGFVCKRKKRTTNGKATLIAVSSRRDGSLQKWLIKHGLRGKCSYDKRIPETVLRGGPVALANFVGAYWSCDGTVARHDSGRTHRAMLTTVSEGLAHDLQHAMLRLGISARIRVRDAKIKTKRQGDTYRYYSVEATDEHNVWKISKLPGLCVRKQWTLVEARPTRFETHLHPDEIVGVVPAGMAPCRCLTVEKDESFTAGDLAVHNSLLMSVSWPAFTWAQTEYGPLKGPHVKFVNVSYDPKLSIRDAIKLKRLLASSWYRERWGERFHLMSDKDRNDMFENSAGGFRFSTSVGGGITGEGGDIVCVDDPINAKKAGWESAREYVNNWWDESVPTRLNDPVTGAKIVVMQRLHEDDLVGHILDKTDEEWIVLNLPMEYDPAVDNRTFVRMADGDYEFNGDGERIPFFEDPREQEGELLWPQRFPRVAVDRLKVELGPFAAAAQLQQTPVPKGGGIIDRLWWRDWPPPEDDAEFRGDAFNPNRYPAMSLIVGSVDTAYGKKDENAWNAMTTWGIWESRRERPQVMLMEGWRARVPLRAVRNAGGVAIDMRTPGDEDPRADPRWGLAERCLHTIRRRRLEILLIENKTRALDLADELRNLLQQGECMVVLLDPEGDKISRMHAVQSFFAEGMVWAPCAKAWADTVITEVSQFPKAKWKDYADTVSQALSWMRREGVLRLGVEADEDNRIRDTFRSRPEVRYDV